MELKLAKVLDVLNGKITENVKFKLKFEDITLTDLPDKVPQQAVFEYLYSYYELDQTVPIQVVVQDFKDKVYPINLVLANKYITQEIPMLKLTMNYYYAVVDFSSPLVASFYKHGILLRHDFETLEEKSIKPFVYQPHTQVQFQ